MKKLFTSCYSKMATFPKDATQVCISRSSPRWWPSGGAKMLVVFDLAPTMRIFKMAKSGSPEWVAEYRQQLEHLAKTTLPAIIEAIPEGAILLCWESDENECHRKILCDFLNETGLAQVVEYMGIKHKTEDVPCPSCYGGHFRPCQMCGDTGVAQKYV